MTFDGVNFVFYREAEAVMCLALNDIARRYFGYIIDAPLLINYVGIIAFNDDTGTRFSNFEAFDSLAFGATIAA